MGVPFGYSIPVPSGEDASYLVELHFVEPDFHSTGARVFDVAVNGRVVRMDMDIFREAGYRMNTPVIVRAVADMSVADPMLRASGRISVSLIPGESSTALICAITIRKFGKNTTELDTLDNSDKLTRPPLNSGNAKAVNLERCLPRRLKGTRACLVGASNGRTLTIMQTALHVGTDHSSVVEGCMTGFVFDLQSGMATSCGEFKPTQGMVYDANLNCVWSHAGGALSKFPAFCTQPLLGGWTSDPASKGDGSVGDVGGR